MNSEHGNLSLGLVRSRVALALPRRKRAVAFESRLLILLVDETPSMELKPAIKMMGKLALTGATEKYRKRSCLRSRSEAQKIKLEDDARQ